MTHEPFSCHQCAFVNDVQDDPPAGYFAFTCSQCGAINAIHTNPVITGMPAPAYKSVQVTWSGKLPLELPHLLREYDAGLKKLTAVQARQALLGGGNSHTLASMVAYRAAELCEKLAALAGVEFFVE